MKIKTISIIMLATLLTACGSKKEEQSADVLTVETESVHTSSDLISTDYVGEVEAETSTAVSFTGMGTVLKVLVSEGQRVEKGQLIAVMDATQARNSLAMAEAMYNQAKDAYERMKVLHEQHSLSDMDWVEVQSKLAQAKASADMARKALKDCSLVAPCSGVIGNKSLEAGMTALPSQPVCNILNINNVKVKVSIPEKEISGLSSAVVGQGVQITVDALGGKTFRASRLEKGVAADIATHTYDVRLTVSNPRGELLPGMVANVRMPASQAQTRSAEGGYNVMSVPVRSVQQEANGKNFVWTVKSGKAARQDVTLGETVDNRIIVKSGLKQGDEVITSGYQKVSEGTKVRSN